MGRSKLRTTSAVNLTMRGDRTPQPKKLPAKSSSFQVPHHSSKPSGLPTYSEDVFLSPLKEDKKFFRASEKGKGDLLPTAVNLNSPQRGYSSDSFWKAPTPAMDNIRKMTQRLRSRRRSDGSFLDSTSDHYRNDHHKWSCSDSDYFSPAGKTRMQGRYSLTNQMQHHFNKREYLQMLVIGLVVFLVYDSYTRAVSTSTRLDSLSSEESMMMLHLQRIEQQSIHLHENLARLTDLSGSIVASDSDSGTRTESVDSNLIQVQTQQLYQMEEELDHELRALQATLQNVARSSIVRTFGEGPVQVVLDLDFPGQPHSSHDSIAILLWYDTPHAAWTWLKQIQEGEWNGASFDAGKHSTIDAAPIIVNAGTLDFVEKSRKGHEAWTVGLSDNGGSLGMFINLQDNSKANKHNVCVGKVIDGFDALQRLVDVSRHNARQTVTIKEATASHLTRNHP